MKLLPVKEHLHENEIFTDNPDCKDTIFLTVDFFGKIGYNRYYVSIDEQLVGSGAFKGKPENRKVEIAYMVFPQHRNKGFGSRIANALVQLAFQPTRT